MAYNLSDLFALTGKVAVVTGGAAGIGLGIATVLAEAGAKVVLADRDHAEASRQAAAITAAGHEAIAVAVDLADEDSITAACTQVVERRRAMAIGEQRGAAGPRAAA